MKARSMTLGLILMLGVILTCTASLQAFSVGEIIVRGSRGMPFMADIPLTLSQHERSLGVTVTLGNQEDYRVEGLKRAEVIDHLEVSWPTATRDTIRLTSREPMQIPTFALVLLVRVGRVTMVKTYHVVLTTPPPKTPQPLAASFSSPSSTPEKTTLRSSKASFPQQPTPSSSQRFPPKNAASPSSASTQSKGDSPPSSLPSWLQHMPRRYGPVKRGATLFGIAKALGAPKETIWQTIVHLWQANTSQFSAGNMHGLRSGTYLIIPADLAESIATMSRRKAQQIVSKQWKAWQTLRRAVSGRQQITPSRERPAQLAEKFVSPPQKSLSVAKGTPAAAAEHTVSPSTMVFPAEHASTSANTADVQSVIQGLEKLLARRSPPAGAPETTTSFVSTADLQVALQGLEERLMQRFRETLQQATPPPKPSPMRSSATVPTLLAQMLPASAMVYVLLVENALLLLFAGAILWRWYQSRP